MSPPEEALSVFEIGDNNGNVFRFDEEPNMLGPEHTYGYNPLKLGDRLGHDPNKQFEIVRKLGWGNNATVWLARAPVNSSRRFAAIKVLTVNGTAGIVDGKLFEDEVLSHISSANPDHPGFRHCMQLHPLGTHLDALRILQPNKVFSVSTTKRIIKQTLLALDFLHTECQVIHTDVKAQNTLVSLGDDDDAIEQYLKEVPSTTYEPRNAPNFFSVPVVTVKSQPLPNFGLQPDAGNINITLVDFGSAIRIDDPRLEDPQPVPLRAPEVILGAAWSTGVDIWSTGCLVFEYLTGRSLFELDRRSSSEERDAVHLRRMSELLQEFEPAFLAVCPHRDLFFDAKGSLVPQGLSSPPIETRLASYKLVDERTVSLATDFMRKCLIINPASRPSASELLRHAWLKDV